MDDRISRKAQLQQVIICLCKPWQYQHDIDIIMPAFGD